MTVKELQVQINERMMNMANMSAGERRAVILGSREQLWESVLDMCCAYTAAEKCGDDLDDIPDLIGKRWRARIASGTVSVRAWCAFASETALMNAIATLSFDEQEELADGKKIKTVVQGTNKMLRVSQMPPDVWPMVFAPGKIRDEVEQRAWLDGQQNKAFARKPVITVDESTGIMRVQNATIDEVEAFLRKRKKGK